jgi:hypothetical protein
LIVHTETQRIHVLLICGGKWHDFDYARLRILTFLASNERVKVSVFSDYDVGDALDDADALITYTCDVIPSIDQQERLAAFVHRGGRWLALHATNSALQPPEPDAPRVFRTPSVSGPFMPLLGSRFLAHPPMGPFQVEVTDPGHPLVEGIEAFEVTDELYVSELFPPIEVLLHTTFSGDCPSFELGRTFDGEPRPVLYLKPHGSGSVCYLSLGHCRGRFDLQDLGVADSGHIQRGPWEMPVFNEILQRAIDWTLTAKID